MKEFEEFINSNKEISPNTIRSYRKSLELFVKYFGITEVKDIDVITKQDILKFRTNLLDNGASASTANSRMRSLSGFFTWLAEFEFIKENPILGIRSLKEPKKDRSFITEEESQKMMDACETLEEKLLVALMITTGIRRMEVPQIKCDDIRDGEIVIHGKGSKDRKLPIHEEVLPLLEEYLQDHTEEYLFVSRWDIGKSKNRMITPETVRNRLKDIMKRAGLDEKRVDELGCHSFRRYCITTLAEADVNMEYIREYAGHSSLVTTQRYIKTSRNHMKEAVANLHVSIK